MPVIPPPHNKLVEGRELETREQEIIKTQLGIDDGSGKLKAPIKVNTPKISVDYGHVYDTDTPIELILRDMLTDTLMPTVKTYSSLTFKHDKGSSYEIGTKVNMTMTFTYEGGFIKTWDPNTGNDTEVILSGDAIKYTYYNKDGSVIGDKLASSGNTVSYDLTVGRTADNKRTASVDIDGSNLPKYYNSDGVEVTSLDSDRKTNISNIILSPAVKGFYYRYTKSDDAIPTGDPSTTMVAAKDTNNTFTLVAKAGKTKHIMALPPGRSFVSGFDVQALGAKVEYVFNGTLNHTLPDGAGTIQYTLYVLEMGEGYSKDHNHTITLGGVIN